MGTRRHYQRADLFLVRLWSKASDDGSNAGSTSGQVGWHGKVQRVVDGAAHLFSSLQGLVDWLRVMPADNKEVKTMSRFRQSGAGITPGSHR